MELPVATLESDIDNGLSCIFHHLYCRHIVLITGDNDGNIINISQHDQIGSEFNIDCFFTTKPICKQVVSNCTSTAVLNRPVFLADAILDSDPSVESVLHCLTPAMDVLCNLVTLCVKCVT